MKNLYIASCDIDGGIYRYTENESGKFEFSELTKMDRPMYMITEGDRMHVILRDPYEKKESGLVSYDINADGSLSNPTEIASTRGEVACHLASDEGNIYCVNYLSGSVTKMPDTVATHEGKGVHPTRQDMAHTHFVCLSPDKKYIFVVDLGIDKIFVYNKELTIKSVTDMPSGHGPRHLAFHKDNETVFCVNELASTVSILKYTDGKLTLIDTVNALPDDFDGESTAAAIRCIDDTVYVSHRGHDSVSVLKYNGKTLALEKTISVYGNGPRDFIIYNDTIISTNEQSDNITVISLENGNLLNEFKAKDPLCVLVR